MKIRFQPVETESLNLQNDCLTFTIKYCILIHHAVLPVRNKDESVTVAFTGNIIFTG